MISNIILVVISCFLWKSIECQPWVPAPGTSETWDFYHRDFAYLAASQPENIQMVFFGDSLTRGWDIGLMRDKFVCPYSAVNFGIDGDQVQNVHWRMINGELNPIEPKIIVLMIGGNNLLIGDDSNEEIAFGIFTILQLIQLHKPETKVLLLGILPSNTGPEFWDRTLDLNGHLEPMANNQSIYYLGLWDEFLEGSPGYGFVDPDIYPDGIHLSKRGYQIYADAIKPTVEYIWEQTLIENSK